jgi:hypothetical protein
MNLTRLALALYLSMQFLFLGTGSGKLENKLSDRVRGGFSGRCIIFFL